MKNTWKPDLLIENIFFNYISHSLYATDFCKRFTYNSNSIEGSPVSEDDTYFIVSTASFLEKYTAKENEEVMGLYKASHLSLQKEMDMFEIHKRVLYFDPDNAGKLRRIQNYIGEHTPPLAVHIPELIKALAVPKTIEDICEYHLQFERIHPFIDGNGRTGRCLMNAQLIALGYAPINIKAREKGKYYRCFRTKNGAQELYNIVSELICEETKRFYEFYPKHKLDKF